MPPRFAVTLLLFLLLVQKPSGGLFGTPAAAKPQSAASIFGNAQSNASSIFGAQPKSNAASIFGNVAAQPTTDMSVLFGLPTKPGTPADSAASIFGTQATMTSTSETSVPASPGGLTFVLHRRVGYLCIASNMKPNLF